MQSRDLALVRGAIGRGAMPVRRPVGSDSTPSAFYIRDCRTGSDGRAMLLVPAAEVGGVLERNPALASAADELVVDVDVWHQAQGRQHHIFEVLGALADEFRTEVVCDTTAYETTAPLWAPAGLDVAALDRPAVERLWETETDRLAQLSDVRQASLAAAGWR
eukprot:TRINITY_DN14313_c0_g1_i1.p5 TRINITY_DN14313_c0_g1~~TRINITY_DN14313_c0_g1_i1.p5  ORF type:complete len:162 (+),score=52.38 TRINITY_DN14313_c0_g1_i1:407-892(+)